MKQLTSQINRRIAKYRTLAGYTQETAAQALGMKKNTYARMERYGNPKPDVLKKLAELFDVKVDNILYGELAEQLNETNTAAPIRLHDATFNAFPPDPPITLTVNEKNCVKMCRNLDKDKRAEIMKIINDFCKENVDNTEQNSK